MSEPLHVAFVWHMHQPYYRSALTGCFDMPWARMHALKDYAGMLHMLAPYPSLHQTFNLVPSLVEQLEVYASGDFSDVYWDHTLKPAVELDETERAFVVERMCERPEHPRARAHRRYLELSHMRESGRSRGWVECARGFSADDIRDLQVWFNLAWFDPVSLEVGPLAELARKARGFSESDKDILARAQAEVIEATLPAYRAATERGQVELTTSPYFHPILPLLCNTDAARIGCPDTLLPPRRFAHPEDAFEQIQAALHKHALVFGERPVGMWCSEQAVGEDVLPLLIESGVRWTISDETVLARSLGGAALSYQTSHSPSDLIGKSPATPRTHSLTPSELYAAYRLEREGSELAMVFRDHTLSDLIGFTYQSWDSRDAANDLLRRLREIRDSPELTPPRGGSRPEIARPEGGPARIGPPALVTIALDGENAWEYYPRGGRDFLKYLYEGLATDESLRCVTVSEHLSDYPPVRALGWLHTGSWIGGDLRTWSGDAGHNIAWDLLHSARDLAASCRDSEGAASRHAERVLDVGGRPEELPSGAPSAAETAWRHVSIAEGSDWYWWFGDHHHTELDYVWDASFRQHLLAVYRALGEHPPPRLFSPLLGETEASRAHEPAGAIDPTIDGVISYAEEWRQAGRLSADLFSTMQPSDTAGLIEIHFGWSDSSLCLLVTPAEGATLEGLEILVMPPSPDAGPDPLLRMSLASRGELSVVARHEILSGPVEATWGEVLEARVPLTSEQKNMISTQGLVVRLRQDDLAERIFRSIGLSTGQ